MSKITFTNKVDSLINSAPAINKIVAADMNEIKTSVNALYDDAPPYKVYTALLSQSGITAPVATVLQNTLAGGVTYSYTNVGAYSVLSSGLFTVGKTTISVTNIQGGIGSAEPANSNQIYLFSTALSGIQTDNYFYFTLIEIRVYN